MSELPLPLHKVNFLRKCALVRVDFNVPLGEDLSVVDDSRIRASIPTLKKIIADGGRCVVMSHMGRPRGKVVDQYSLKHIVPIVEERLGATVQFVDNCVGERAKASAAALKPGEVLLLENLRFYDGEEACCTEFAKKLSQMGDVYINDAFGTAHRNHASIAIVPRFFEKKYLGLSMSAELTHAKRLFEQAKSPFVAVVGGAKISDKIVLLGRLLDKVDRLIIGGGMAYTFYRALGGVVGQSLVETDKLGLAKELAEEAKRKGVTLLLPVDSIVGDKLDAGARTALADSCRIAAGWMGLDIGPKARRIFSTAILDAKTILWNGPMGVFEIEKFAAGTKAVGEAVAEATKRGAFSLVGGGDSVAATTQFGLRHSMSYISMGGGALLAYFEGKPLPAIEALRTTVSR